MLATTTTARNHSFQSTSTPKGGMKPLIGPYSWAACIEFQSTSTPKGG